MGGIKVVTDNGLMNEIIKSVKDAGKIAMDFYGTEKGTMKIDGTWLTKADFKIEKFLRQQISKILNVRIFGEEGLWTGNENEQYTAIIDPIDGTALFKAKIPIWGISVAIFNHKTPWLGIFYMPATETIYIGINDTRAQKNNETINITPTYPSKDSYIGVSSDAHLYSLDNYPGKVRAFGVSALHLLLVTTGEFQSALFTRFNLYDIAAAAIIHWAAGGVLYYISGEEVKPDEFVKSGENKKGAILACHPQTYVETRACVMIGST